jgi:hypothetical protein
MRTILNPLISNKDQNVTIMMYQFLMESLAIAKVVFLCFSTMYFHFGNKINPSLLF